MVFPGILFGREQKSAESHRDSTCHPKGQDREFLFGNEINGKDLPSLKRIVADIGSKTPRKTEAFARMVAFRTKTR
jgi:hypothetical protein